MSSLPAQSWRLPRPGHARAGPAPSRRRDDARPEIRVGRGSSDVGGKIWRTFGSFGRDAGAGAAPRPYTRRADRARGRGPAAGARYPCRRTLIASGRQACSGRVPIDAIRALHAGGASRRVEVLPSESTALVAGLEWRTWAGLRDPQVATGDPRGPARVPHRATALQHQEAAARRRVRALRAGGARPHGPDHRRATLSGAAMFCVVFALRRDERSPASASMPPTWSRPAPTARRRPRPRSGRSRHRTITASRRWRAPRGGSAVRRLLPGPAASVLSGTIRRFRSESTLIRPPLPAQVAALDLWTHRRSLRARGRART